MGAKIRTSFQLGRLTIFLGPTKYQSSVTLRATWSVHVTEHQSNSFSFFNYITTTYCDRRPRGKPFVKIIDGLYLSDRKSHFTCGASPFINNFGSIRYWHKPRHMHTVVMAIGTCICEKEIGFPCLVVGYAAIIIIEKVSIRKN